MKYDISAVKDQYGVSVLKWEPLVDNSKLDVTWLTIFSYLQLFIDQYTFHAKIIKNGIALNWLVWDT